MDDKIWQALITSDLCLVCQAVFNPRYSLKDGFHAFGVDILVLSKSGDLLIKSLREEER